MKKIVSRILIGLLIVVIIAGTGGFYYFGSYLPNTIAPKSFPQIDGEIHVQGLNERHERYRDE